MYSPLHGQRGTGVRVGGTNQGTYTHSTHELSIDSLILAVTTCKYLAMCMCMCVSYAPSLFPLRQCETMVCDQVVQCVTQGVTDVPVLHEVIKH